MRKLNLIKLADGTYHNQVYCPKCKVYEDVNVEVNTSPENNFIDMDELEVTIDNCNNCGSEFLSNNVFEHIKLLHSYSEKEKIEVFDKLYKEAEDFFSWAISSEYHDEGVDAFQSQIFEEVVELLGPKAWNIINDVN